jgi:hypothetical protein
MRAAVLSRIATTRQLPPQVLPSDDGVPPERIVNWPVGIPRDGVADPIGVDPEPHLPEVVDLASRRRVSGRLLLAVAVAAIAALVGVGAVFIFDRGDKVPGADALRICLQSASDQHIVSAAVDSVGVSKVTVSASCGAALVQLSAIPAAPSGHTYQLWVLAGSEARSVGTMLPDDDGTMPDVVAPVHVGDTALGVTVEPSGGSTAPTTIPLITVPLS